MVFGTHRQAGFVISLQLSIVFIFDSFDALGHLDSSLPEIGHGELEEAELRGYMAVEDIKHTHSSEHDEGDSEYQHDLPDGHCRVDDQRVDPER